MRWISEHVVVTGGAVTPENWSDFQAEYGITVVVNLRAERQDRFAGPLPEAYLWLPVIDHTDPSLTQLVVGAQFIDAMVKAGHKVMVHCYMGIGRSRSVAMAYLIWTGCTVDEAMIQVEGTPDPRYRPERRELLGRFAAHIQNL